MAQPVVAIGKIVPKAVEDILRGSGVPMELFRLPGFGEDEVIQAAANADVIVIGSREKITRRVLGSLPRCRAVARCGVGVDNVDLPAATEFGILVTCVPDASVEEVSDTAVAFVLACARRIVPLNHAIKAGEWTRDGGAAVMAVRSGMRRLHGLNLGIVGFGRIGRTTWRKARAFGFNGLVYDPLVPAESIRAEGCEPVGKDDLLSMSDFITLHVPLTPESQKMFNREVFARMKPTAYLINTARGAIVDEGALAEAVRGGVIAGACIDVTSVEPIPQDHPLAHVDRVILTGHSAFASDESNADLSSGTAQSVLGVVRGEVPRGLLNPEAMVQAKSRAM